MDLEELLRDSRAFLGWVVGWYNRRPLLELAETIETAGGAHKVSIFAVDVTHGFCSDGPLSSQRVGRLVDPIVHLFELAYRLGIRLFVLPQDAHSTDAVEFECFPAHCVEGTVEPETVPELAGLPFFDLVTTIRKDTVSSAIGTELDAWLSGHAEVNTFLVSGDCTDLCVYQLAMHLRLRANALGLRDVRVIVPVDGVDTYDLSVEVANEIGALPHPGDLMHLIFLFSMAQNGVEIVKGVR